MVVSPNSSFFYKFLLLLLLIIFHPISFSEFSTQILVLSLLSWKFGVWFYSLSTCKFEKWYGKFFVLVEVQDHQHRGIENSDAVNMVKSKIFFPNYVKIIDFPINNCMVHQMQWGYADLVHCSLFENEFVLILLVQNQLKMVVTELIWLYLIFLYYLL